MSQSATVQQWICQAIKHSTTVELEARAPEQPQDVVSRELTALLQSTKRCVQQLDAAHVVAMGVALSEPERRQIGADLMQRALPVMADDGGRSPDRVRAVLHEAVREHIDSWDPQRGSWRGLVRSGSRWHFASATTAPPPGSRHR